MCTFVHPPCVNCSKFQIVCTFNLYFMCTPCTRRELQLMLEHWQTRFEEPTSPQFCTNIYMQYFAQIFMRNIFDKYLCAIFCTNIYVQYFAQIFMCNIFHKYLCAIFWISFRCSFAWETRYINWERKVHFSNSLDWEGANLGQHVQNSKCFRTT